MGELTGGSDGPGGPDVPPAGEGVNLDAYGPMFGGGQARVDGFARVNGSARINGGRYAPRENPPTAADQASGKPRALSEYEVRERIYDYTGLPEGLPSHLEPHRGSIASTDAGAVFADRTDFDAADAGAENIVSDARKLQAIPDTYVFQCAGTTDGPDTGLPTLPEDLGLLILADPYYHDGTDIRLTFPAGEEFRETLARMTQARVFAPPAGFLARGDADGRLVIASGEQYGTGGPPYPAGDAAGWLITEPAPPATW